MKETPYIRSVTPLEGMRLYVTFGNGEQRILDLKPFVNGSEFFGELNDPDYFREVRLVWGGHGIEWPHEQDLSKDTVYARSKELFVAPQSLSDLIYLVGRMTRGLFRIERESFGKTRREPVRSADVIGADLPRYGSEAANR